MIKKLLFSTACCFILAGCANDSPDDLVAAPITGDITYTNTIKAIIDSNCLQCHSAVPQNGAPMPLTTYEQVQNAVQIRNAIGRITRQNGDDLLMPQGGPRLPQNKIDAIIQWKAANCPQ